MRVHYNLLNVERRGARSPSPNHVGGRGSRSKTPINSAKSPKPKRKASTKSARKNTVTKTKNAVKLRWTQKSPVNPMNDNGKGVQDSLDMLDFHGLVEDCTETVVANLVYDEECDEIVSSPIKKVEGKAKDNAKEVMIANPVFSAFEQAKNVDDLYRIAEIWVNPVLYTEN